MESSTLMLPMLRNAYLQMIVLLKHRWRHCTGVHPVAVLALCGLLLLPTACRRGEAQSAQGEPAMIRTPRPTFTPTPGQAPVTAATAVQEGAPAAVIAPTATPDVSAQPAEIVPSGASVVVNTPLVNVRSGPGLDYEVVTIVERGQEFDILAKDALGEWWQVCCIEEEAIWIIGQLVDTIGPVDSVPVFGASQLTSGSSGEEVASPVNVAADQPADIQFDLVGQERFLESANVRVFAYIYEESDGLAGYSLWVRKDGVDLPVNVVSFGGSPGFTWAFQDARQRSQNWRAEFPDVPPVGAWEIQLIDEEGRIVGPAATFDIGPGDTDLELYVRYERR